MQALAEFAEKDKALRPQIIKRLEAIINTGSPAMVSRGKKLIKKLKKRCIETTYENITLKNQFFASIISNNNLTLLL